MTTSDLFEASKSEEERERAESQIIEKQKITDYDIREYPVEVIVDKYMRKREDGLAEIFVPDYQRELVWQPRQKSLFIESVLLNLPIPYLFVADSDGRLEIVDGSQRIRTLAQFVNNAFPLRQLEILTALDGFYFKDLPTKRQSRFKRKTLRMIELTEQADEEARRMMFDRLNSGGSRLVDMEQRLGSRPGPMTDLIVDIAKNHSLLRAVCPVSEAKRKRKEYEEMILRHFAYVDRYEKFQHDVDEFLTNYLKEANQAIADGVWNAAELRARFDEMVKFVASRFPHGFKKDSNNTSVPRIRFEAISVGAALALRELSREEKEVSEVPSVDQWLYSEQFKTLTRSDASNSRPKVIDRITFVRDHLLGRKWKAYGDAALDDLLAE